MVMVALIAAFPPTLTIVLTHRATERARKASEAEKKKTDEKIIGSLAEVHDLTNSTATEQRNEIKALRKEVAESRDEVAALRAHVTKTLPDGQTSQDVVPEPEKKK